MTNPNVEFTRVTSFRAEALGEPGQRTFRILVDTDSGSAMMWLEKEQLLQLALAIGQLQASLPEGGDSAGRGATEDEPQPSVHLEFKIGKLALGHEGHGDKFMIDAHDAEEDEAPAVRVWGRRNMLAAFAKESLQICAAGRPICPLCGGAIDADGHTCPRSNGHQREELIEI